MRRCHYLAFDYEAEYTEKWRDLLQRIAIKHIESPPDHIIALKSTQGYRKPWTRGKKEHIFDDVPARRVKNLTKVLHQNFTEFEHIVSGAVHKEIKKQDKFTIEHQAIPPENLKWNENTSSCFEDLVAMKSTRKLLPSISCLLHKHGPMVLSDPYEQIKIEFKYFERISTSLQMMKSADFHHTEKFEEFTKVNSSQTISCNVSTLELDEEFFIHERNLTKERHDWPQVEKFVLEDMLPKKNEMNEFLNCQELAISSQEDLGPSGHASIDNAIALLDSKFDQDITTYELEQIALSSVKRPYRREEFGLCTEMIKFNVFDSIARDLRRLNEGKKVEELGKEDCNAILVSRILLPEVNLKPLKGSLPAEISKLSALCWKHAKLLNGDKEPLMNWNITKSVKNMVAYLQASENLTNYSNTAILTKRVGQTKQGTFVTECESFDNLKQELLLNPAICNQASANASHDCFNCDDDYTVKGQTNLESQVDDKVKLKSLRNSGTVWNKMTPVYSTKKCEGVQLAKSSLASEKATHQMYSTAARKPVSRLDEFLQLRDLSSTNPFQQTFSKNNFYTSCQSVGLLHANVKEKPTSAGISGAESRESNCKSIKVYATGELLKMILKLENIIEPVLQRLKSMSIIPTSCTMHTLDVDNTKYLLKEASKHSENSGFTLHQISSYVLLATLHCFVLCKCTLLNTSARSALGCMVDFYQSKKEKLRSLHESDSAPPTSILYLIPKAIYDLQHFISSASFVHPKLEKLVKIIRERFSKDIKRGVELSKVLILCSTYCHRLFDEIMNAFDDVNKGSLQNALKLVALPLSCHTRFLKDLKKCNVIIMATSLFTLKFPWTSFKLVLEFDTCAPNSPWKRICNEHGIRHIALEMERSECIKNLNAIDIENFENEEVVTMMGSSGITNCGSLLHLLEARHNITIIEGYFGHFEWNGLALNTFEYASRSNRSVPDLILDCGTCIIVENFASLSSENDVQSVHDLLFRLLDLQMKFVKCYIIISNLSFEKSGYPLNGDFPINLARIHAAANNFLKKTSEFEMTIFCSFGFEHFAYLINHLVTKCRSSQTSAIGRDKSRMQLHSSVTMHERFLSQFQSINIWAAREILGTMNLREIASRHLKDLKECYPNIPLQFLEDFYNKLHQCSTPTSDSLISQVDFTPEFSSCVDNDCEMSEPDADALEFFTRFSNNFKESNSQAACENYQERSYQLHNPCRKRLRFEKIKGGKMARLY